MSQKYAPTAKLLIFIFIEVTALISGLGLVEHFVEIYLKLSVPFHQLIREHGSKPHPQYVLPWMPHERKFTEGVGVHLGSQTQQCPYHRRAHRHLPSLSLSLRSPHLSLSLSLSLKLFLIYRTVMGVLKVYGQVLSTAAQRVIACINEKGLEYKLVVVNMREGDHKKEPFLSLNPFGQVPAFEDGDFKLFESRAITKYISQEYESSGTQLIYADTKKMAVMTAWMEVEAIQFDSVTTTLAWELVFKTLFGLATNEAVVEENEAKLAKILDVYEKRLSESKYLGGEDFTLVDLHHLPHMYCMMGTSIKKLFDSRPRVSAWSQDIMGRPSWLKIVEMIQKNPPPPPGMVSLSVLSLQEKLGE